MLKRFITEIWHWRALVMIQPQNETYLFKLTYFLMGLSEFDAEFFKQLNLIFNLDILTELQMPYPSKNISKLTHVLICYDSTIIQKST